MKKGDSARTTSELYFLIQVQLIVLYCIRYLRYSWAGKPSSATTRKEGFSNWGIRVAWTPNVCTRYTCKEMYWFFHSIQAKKEKITKPTSNSSSEEESEDKKEVGDESSSNDKETHKNDKQPSTSSGSGLKKSPSGKNISYVDHMTSHTNWPDRAKSIKGGYFMGVDHLLSLWSKYSKNSGHVTHHGISLKIQFNPLITVSRGKEICPRPSPPCAKRCIWRRSSSHDYSWY